MEQGDTGSIGIAQKLFSSKARSIKLVKGKYQVWRGKQNFTGEYQNQNEIAWWSQEGVRLSMDPPRPIGYIGEAIGKHSKATTALKGTILQNFNQG